MYTHWVMTLVLMGLLTVGSTRTLQDYIDDYIGDMGQRTHRTFNRGHVFNLTCDPEDITGSRTFEWYVEGGESLLEWSQNVSWQASSASDSGNIVTIKASKNSQVKKILLYCVDNNGAIGNLFDLLLKDNSKLIGAHHVLGPCPLHDDYYTALSCKGATRQDTGHCTWYKDKRKNDLKKVIGPVLVLGYHAVPAVPGHYWCECKIYTKTTGLREFEVINGEPQDSFFCKSIPKKALMTSSALLDVTSELSEEITMVPTTKEAQEQRQDLPKTTSAPLVSANTVDDMQSKSVIGSSQTSNEAIPALTKVIHSLTKRSENSEPTKLSLGQYPQPTLQSLNQMDESHEQDDKKLIWILIGTICCLACVILVLISALVIKRKAARREKKNTPENYELTPMGNGTSSGSATTERHLLDKNVPLHDVTHHTHEYV